MTGPRTGSCPDCDAELDGGLCADCGRTFVTVETSVSDREYVAERAEQQNSVFDTTPVGPGLLVVYRDRHSEVLGYGGLLSKHGWYVASYERNDESSDIAILMPVTEVLN